MEIKKEIVGTYCNNCKCKVEPIYLLSEKMSVCVKCSSKDIKPLIKKWVAPDDVIKKVWEVFSEGFFMYFQTTYGVDNMKINEKMIEDINKKVKELVNSLSNEKGKK